MDQMDELLKRFVARDRAALARVLTLVEHDVLSSDPRDHLSAEAIAGELTYVDSTFVVGITGSGGSGKSTLVGALIRRLRALEKRVAVLACDPSSPVTGGALLGDRIRVEIEPTDDAVFFRSLSTRGAAGGISAAVSKLIPWIRAFGFDVLLIETVGVGQDQAAIRPLVDRLVLLVTPNTGDEVQWEKAGVIELVDVIVVNKCDLEGANRVQAQLINALSLSAGEKTKVVMTIASTGDGVDALWEAIDSHE